MGCIEIAVYVLSLRLTWMFNRNMGCIEITSLPCRTVPVLMFNRNMGCIEIFLFPPAIRNAKGLIETWDVLK